MNECVQLIEEFKKKEVSVLKEEKQQGTPVAALFNRLFPPALLYGMGYRPIRIVSGTTIEMESACEQLIRPDACPFCKSILGNYLRESGLHALTDIVVGLIPCDQMRRTLERISVDIGKPVFPVQMPATISKESKEYYSAGVSSVCENIAAFANATIDYEKVREYEQHRADAASLLKTLYQQGNVDPVILHKLGTLFSWVRPQSLNAFLNDLIPSIQTFTPHSKIILLGSVLGEEDDTILKLLSKHHVFPLLLNSSGLNAFEGITPLEDVADEQMVSHLAFNIFKQPAGIRTRPNSAVYERIQYYIDTYDVTGIILKSLLFCDLWYTEKVRLKKSFPLPTLVLNTGYGEGIEGSTATRIEAFLETIA